LTLVQNEFGLLITPALPGLGNGRDESGLTAVLDDLLSRLALVIKFPVPRRVLVRRVQDWSLEKLRIGLKVSLRH
jgi:hypothetical protein